MVPRLAAAVGLLALAACVSRDELPADAGIPDAGGVPLAVIATRVGFAPQTLTPMNAGGLLAADRDAPVLHLLDGESLASQDAGAVAITPWAPIAAKAGRGGAAFLLNDGGAFYALDLDMGGLTPFAQASAPVVAFSGRRDLASLAWASEDGGLHLLYEDGGEAEVLTAPSGMHVEDLVVDGRGRVLVLLSQAGRCNTVAVFRAAEAGPQTVDLGAPPCVLALSHDNVALWAAGQGDGGAIVLEMAADQLPANANGPRYEVPGIQPRQLVLADNRSRVALLGVPPGATVAVARQTDLGTRPDAFKTVPASQLASAADAFFDENGALLVADPDGGTVTLVR